MKELSIWEKAKRYDDIRLKVERYWESGEMSEDMRNYLFPELAESEDERIKNFISNELACLRATDEKGSDRYEELTKAIYWLERQSEQNTSFSDVQTYLKGVDRVQSYSELSEYEKIFDRIADTYAHRKNKEGYNEIWYVKERAAEMLYHAKKELEKQGGKGANGNEREIPIPEPPLTIKHAKEVMGIKQNDAWSEEDEKQARQIERIVHDDGCTQKLQKQIADWLKSLKDRVQPQPKNEWNEEDGEPILSNYHKEHSAENPYIQVLDSCEYICWNSRMAHKGNCRFCKERRQKELEELVIKLKEK